jgi:3-deoxy-D-manno-octulosonic-acid transferase
MWDWLIWGALILTFVAGIAAGALLVVRALEGWRSVRRTSRNLAGQLDEFAAKGEATAERLAAVGDTAELEESLGRLRISLAQLAVLRNALDEVDETFGRVAAFVPRK